jgi:hypothetical protein
VKRSTPVVRAWVGGIGCRELLVVRESEHTGDARWVYTMRVAGGRGARCSRGCEVELIETLREMAA